MKIKTIIFLVLAAMLTSVIISYSIYTVFYKVESKYINMYVTAGDYIGFKTDTDALWFGTIRPGSSAKRFVNVTNTHDYPIHVKFSAQGEIAQWVYSSANDFWLDPHTARKVDVIVNLPPTVSYGNYSGVFFIEFTRT